MKPIHIGVILILCASISVMIVIHSYSYISQFMDKTLAMMMAAIIEICFISYSIFATLAGRWGLGDKVLKAFIFFLSVVPATMEVTEKSMELLVPKLALQEPSRPEASTRPIESLEQGIVMIDKEVESLRNFKGSYDVNKQDRTWYAYQDQKRIDKLLERREKLNADKIALEKEQEERLRQYETEMREFRAQTKTDEFSLFFDFLFLSWTLAVIWILQLVNGRLSGNASRIIGGDHVVLDSTGLHEELEGDFKDYLIQRKPALISKSKFLQFFIDRHVYSYEGFYNFLTVEYDEKQSEFTKGLFGRKLQDFLQSERKKLEDQMETIESTLQSPTI